MTTTAGKAPGWRKIAVQAFVGGIAGAGGMIAALSLIEWQGGRDWAPSAIILIGVGLVYALMGLLVGIGTLAPRLLGQRLLNVTDAEEIVEKRAHMGASAVCCLVLGVALMLLAHSVATAAEGGAALVTPPVAYGLLVAVLSVFALVSMWMWKRFDELWRQLTVDTGAIAGNLILPVLILWGGASAVGLTDGPHALDLVSLSFGALLVACFIAVGRRGMMTPQ